MEADQIVGELLTSKVVSDYNIDIKPGQIKDESSEDPHSDDVTEEFAGFSPPSSPGKSGAHQTAEVLENEIKRLDVKEEKNDAKEHSIVIKEEETEADPVQTCQTKSVDAPTRENGDVPNDVSSRSVELSFAGLKQRRSSRGSSPADSVSSRGSARRSVSVSSRDSKGSHKSSVPFSISSTRYRLPFEHGWRREVLLKEMNSEVTYIHPSGLKLKSLREVSENLTPGLSIESFTFTPEPLNVSSEYEKVTNYNQSSVRKSGRTITPSSNYKIVEMREEESRKRTPSDSPMAPPAKRAKIVLKLNRTSIEKPPEIKDEGKMSFTRSERSDESVPHQHPQAPRGPLRKVTPGFNSTVVEDQTYASDGVKTEPRKRRRSRKKASASEGRPRKSSEGGWDSGKSSTEEPRRICSIACPKAMGLIPTLQCCICLCLYHPECAEVPRTSQAQNIQSYICKSCRGKPEVRKAKTEANITVAPTPPAPAPPPAAPPPASAQQPVAPPVQSVPQILVSVNRRRFIMVPDLTTPPAATPTSSRIVSQQPMAADMPGTSADMSIVKPEGAATKKQKLKESDGNQNFMRNLCSGYTALLRVFEYLTAKELLDVSQVCRLWRDIAQHMTLWKKVHVKNFKVKDWESFAAYLYQRGTRHLDLTELPVSVDSSNLKALPAIRSLERLDFDRVTARVFSYVIEKSPGLKVCTAQLNSDGEEDEHLRLNIFSDCHRLEELRIHYQGGSPLLVSSIDFSQIASTLTSLSLLSLSGWRDLEMSSFQKLSELTELELGDCSSLPLDFPSHLISLKRLRRIRLERATEPSPCFAIVDALSSLPDLRDVELINIDVRSGFDIALGRLRNVQTMLLIPTYVSQSATTISLILQGTYQLRESLSKLTWVFTEELLKITELYLDQMADHSIRGGSCVPILTPVPSPEIKSTNEALWAEVAERYSEAIGTVAVVPLEQLHQMLMAALPNTQTRVIKLPFQSTCRRIE